MGGFEGPRTVKDSLSLLLDAGNASSYSGSGTTWYDLSGSGNHGTLQAAPTYGSGTFTFTAASSQYVSTRNLITNPTEGSIGIWFKTSTASGKKLIGLENQQLGQSSSAYDRMIYMGSDGRLYGGVFDGAIKTALSTNTLTDNLWHYAIITYKINSNLILYVDGVQQQSTAIGTPQVYDGYYRIGSYRLINWTSASDGYYTGSIAYAHIYNRLLTADEISQNFHALRGRFGV